MDYLQKIIGEIEIHSVEGIKICFENGISPNELFMNKPLINELITQYGRGPKFCECFKVFVDYGLKFDDKVLLAVFLDDADSLEVLLNENREALDYRYTFNCAFTPLYQASLLHICAEYNHVSCAKILVKQGMDVNVRAGMNQIGFGGQTPIFHTVNQHANACIEMMDFLASNNADLSVTVQGLIWGGGYDWETFIPSVNPISYAMMGLLPQFQRQEKSIYKVVSILIKAKYGVDYTPTNIPNKYLM